MKPGSSRLLTGISVALLVALGALAYALLTPEPPRSQYRQPPQAPGAPAPQAPPSGHLARAAPAIYHDLKPPDELMAGLHYRYYPERLSQWWEELLIRDFFEDKRGGFFVDVGSNHYKVRSTTHYIDVALGWSGIAIDAIAELAEGFEKHRPRTTFVPAFVGEKSDEDVDFYIVMSNTRVSTADKDHADQHATREGQIERQLKTMTLTDILDARGVKQIDLLKMDIEMWEPAALRGLDIDRFKPRLVVLELHDKVRDEILAYMDAHGYVKLEQYMEWDSGGWFVPREELPAFLARKARDPIWKPHLPAQAADGERSGFPAR